MDEYDAGVYFAAVLAIALLVLVCDAGLELAFVKQFPERDADGQKWLFSAALIARTALCLAISVIFMVGITTFGAGILEDIADAAALVLAIFLIQSYRSLLFRVLQAQKRFFHFAVGQASAALLKAIFIPFLIFVDDLQIKHVLAVEAVAFLASLIYTMAVARQTFSFQIDARREDVWGLLRFGWPVYVNALMNLGNERTANYIVAVMGGPIALAFFSVAERLADAGRRLFTSFTNVYLPLQTSHFANKDTEAAKYLASRSLLWIAMIVGLGAVTFALIREPVVALLFTTRYIEAADATVVFIVALMFRSLQVIMGYFSVAAGHNFLPVKVSIASSVFSIAMTIWLFNMFGYEGAAAALMLTQAFMAGLYIYWLRRAGLALDIIPALVVVASVLAALGWIFWADDQVLFAIIALPAMIAVNLWLAPALRTDAQIAFRKAQGYLNGAWPDRLDTAASQAEVGDTSPQGLRRALMKARAQRRRR